MGAFGQICVVTRLGLHSIPNRLGPSLVIIVGMACVVGALVSILSLSAGLIHTIQGTGRADRALVLGQGSLTEAASSISRDEAVAIADFPGIKKAPDDKPIVSVEALTSALVPEKSDGSNAFVTVRGIGPEGSVLRPEIKLISGHMFTPGKYELIVGKLAQAQFDDVGIGQKVNLPGGDWTVTGIFESNGDANESELITDAPTLLSALRHTAYNSATVLLNSPEQFGKFQKTLTSTPNLSVEVARETDFLAQEWSDVNGMLTLVAYVIGGIMGLGAMFGALNTMYAAVSARVVEIATLRALGFGSLAVVVSVLFEFMLLATIGAFIGAAIAWILFDGDLHAMRGLVVQLSVSPLLMMIGIAFACILGFVGGLFPSIRAARLPVATALRAT